MGYIPAPPPRLGGMLGYMESRRSDVNRVNDFLIKPHRVSGFYEFKFMGTETTQEVLLDVKFPVYFVDKPGFSFGGELMRDIVVDGSFPMISAVVVKWTKVDELRPGGGCFIGAQFAVVASGREGEEMILHWQMDGKAMIVSGTEVNGNDG